MRAELTGKNGIVLDLPYSDLIHIRLGYGANQYLGGDANGRADFRAMLGNLQTLSVIKESIPKALESSLSLKGIFSMKTVADADKRTITREEFEKHLFDSKYGIVATDYVADISRQIHRRRIHRVLSNGGRRLVVANCRGFQNNIVYPASTCIRTHDKVLRQNRTIVIVCPPSRNRGNDQRRRVVITRRTPRVVGL